MDPSTFSFVMDAFPDYTAFDHQHKVFAAIQIVGEENIHPADPDQAKDTTCAPLPFEVQVYAGTGEFNEDYTQFPDDPDEVQFKSLGSYLSATADRANIDFKGTLRRVDNWTAFSDKPADLTGYYYPFSMVAVDDKGQPMTGDVTMTYTTLSGVSKTTKFVGGKLDTIFAIDPNAPVYTMTFSNGTDNVIYSMDFSRCAFQ